MPASSITRAIRTARRSTIASGSSSRRSRRFPPERNSCTITSTSAPTTTPRRTSGSTSAGAAHRSVAGRSSHQNRPKTNVSAPAATLRAMMRRLVDYAGLFPPAELSMQDAAARYAEYLRSPDAWMLGRFVVPAERLDELAACAEPHLRPGGEGWRISAIVGADKNAGPRVRAFNSAQRGRLMVDVVECRPITHGSVASTIGALPGELRIFVELPLLDDPRTGLLEIRGAGAWAKIRTGGVTADAIPSAREVGRFLARAAELIVP